MFASTLSNATKNDYLSERFRLCYEWLASDKAKTLPEGSYPIDGDAAVANVQEYETSPATERRFETHDRFYDIQYVMSGKESFGVCRRDTLKPAPYDAQNDISFYDDPEYATYVTLLPGDLIIVSTDDAHKPRCTVDGKPEHVRKIVIKVKADE